MHYRISVTQPTIHFLISKGWTEWMDTSKPSASGESEILPELRKRYTFCSNNELTAVQCRLTKDSQLLNQISSNVQCTKDRGLVCNNFEGQICGDYEVRFFCDCNTTGKIILAALYDESRI